MNVRTCLVVAPLRLEIRHYETIAAIIEFGTMTEAARHLSVTQSAMSHRLAQAERRLGESLFSRGPDRRLAPTAHGIAVAQAAIRAIAELQRVEDALAGTASGVEVMVRLGVGSYDCFDWFPTFRSTVRDRHPEIELDLAVVGDAPGAALAGRDVDVVLAPGRPAGDHELVPMFDDELVLVCARSHPLADAGTIEAVDLTAETYHTYNAQPTPGFEYDRFVRPSGEAPRIVRVVPQTSAVIELVAAGAGVSVLSRWATAAAVAAGRLATARCGTAGLPITWHAAYRRHDGVAADVTVALREHLAR
jgi:LysR family transcriptional regulator for metE and metH